MALIFFFWGGLMAQQSSVAGTATDFDGNFSINAQNGEVLIVSYVGNQSNYNISLQTDNALEEVVVTTAFF